MAAKKKAPRRGRPPQLREGVTIPGLRAAKQATAADLGVSGAHMATLVEAGLVKVVGTVKSGRKGRPANIYSLTPQGNGKATAIANAEKKVAVA